MLREKTFDTGTSVGRLLMQQAEQWAREQGYSEVILRSNVIRARAHKFYESLGYTPIKSQKVFRKVTPPTRKDVSTQNAVKREPQHIFGIDFSGAQEAGLKIWIASGMDTGEQLRIETCDSAAKLFGSKDRDHCLRSLYDFVGSKNDSIFAFDFPFGLPCALVEEAEWVKFVLGFPSRYPNGYEAFAEKCRTMSGGRELRRLTDVVTKTPLSPYNRRLAAQTYFGIKDVLRPLIQKGEACVLPMQEALPGKPLLIEVCPASTVLFAKLDTRYKGRKLDKGKRVQRENVLRWLMESGNVSIKGQVCSTAIANNEGDALDSVIAAFAAYRAYSGKFQVSDRGKHAYALEGYVYL